jgi:hypothetical protein
MPKVTSLRHQREGPGVTVATSGAMTNLTLVNDLDRPNVLESCIGDLKPTIGGTSESQPTDTNVVLCLVRSRTTLLSQITAAAAMVGR